MEHAVYPGGHMKKEKYLTVGTETWAKGDLLDTVASFLVAVSLVPRI